jgi:hypothetical protein
VLILLDACFAGGSVSSSSQRVFHEKGITEMIAACGYGREINGQGSNPFATALTTELRRIADDNEETSVQVLHRRALGNVIRRGQDPNTGAIYTSPVYIHLDVDQRPPSIS